MLEISKKVALIVAAAVLMVVVSIIFIFRTDDNGNEIIIAQDTKIAGDYNVPEDATLVLKNDAILAITGNFDMSGSIRSEGDLNLAIAGNIYFSKDAKVVSAGNIQIVGTPDRILKTDEEIQKAFEKAGTVSENANSFGPFNDETEGDAKTLLGNIDGQASNNTQMIFMPPFVSVAYAQMADDPLGDPPEDVEVGIFQGEWSFEEGDERDRKVLILRPQPTKMRMIFDNLIITAPTAPDGESDTFNRCEARGKNGKNGLRTNFAAYQIVVNSATVNLAAGGNGGEAITKDDCAEAIAKGGNGGEPGNIKMTATEGIYIAGNFIINPGLAGDGGNARAKGGSGAQNGQGGSAYAKGGNGADNTKKLFVKGKVQLMLGRPSEFSIGEIAAGDGGNAYAEGGSGRDGEKCGEKGYKGGWARAIGGDGGNANALNGNWGSAPTYFGFGGEAEATGGQGGNGAPGTLCGAVTGAAGDGGDGGDAVEAKLGQDGGGKGAQENPYGSGIFTAVGKGGNGGDGGNGCPRGRGGTGGIGKGLQSINGQNGSHGTERCAIISEEPTDDLSQQLDTQREKNTEDELTFDPECQVPEEVLSQAYPPDVYKRTITDKNEKVEITFTRDSCVSKSEESVRRGAEVWLPDFQEYCPNTKITDISFSGMMQPCGVTMTFD